MDHYIGGSVSTRSSERDSERLTVFEVSLHSVHLGSPVVHLQSSSHVLVLALQTEDHCARNRIEGLDSLVGDLHPRRTVSPLPERREPRQLTSCRSFT